MGSSSSARPAGQEESTERRRNRQSLLRGGGLSLAGAVCLVGGVIVTPLGLISALGPTAGSGDLQTLAVAGMVLAVGATFFYPGIGTLSRSGHLTPSAPTSSRSQALIGACARAGG